MATKRRRVYRRNRRRVMRRTRRYTRSSRTARRPYRRTARRTKITRRRLNILPADQVYIKFRSTGYATFNIGTSATTAQQAIKANSFYYPLGGSTATRPYILGMTDYYQWYNTYQITGCKVTATFYNLISSPIAAFIIPSVDPLNPSVGYEELVLCAPYGRNKLLAPIAQGNHNTCTITNYMSTSKIFGTKNASTDDNYTGAYSGSISTAGDPNKLWNMYVGISTCDGTNFTTALNLAYVSFKITWYTRLFKKTNLV